MIIKLFGKIISRKKYPTYCNLSSKYFKNKQKSAQNVTIISLQISLHEYNLYINKKKTESIHDKQKARIENGLLYSNHSKNIYIKSVINELNHFLSLVFVYFVWH